MEDMTDWEDGVYSRDEKCPHCGSTNTAVTIHGGIRQWWCQACEQPFMPSELKTGEMETEEDKEVKGEDKK